MVRAWLEFHRGTLATKCAGLTDEQLRTRSVEPSNLSLIGLLRHMAEVENWWFNSVFAGGSTDSIYCSDEYPDGDFDLIADATCAEAFEKWAAACELSRQLTAGKDLDATGTRPGEGAEGGKKYSLRWIMVHMIEEYARHNGHADLLRERLDGAVGE